MAATDKLFAGAIPDLYDRLLVPMIFEPFAQDLAERVAALKPRDVLEVAAGTGVVTRAMASRLGGAVRIIASDLNQPMLDRAMSQQGGDAHIEWRQADALALPFEALSFDVVACQFGVMFFPDKETGYREARRVLRPGGHYLFNIWDDLATNEFPLVVTQALEELFPDDPPHFMARVPHGYCDLATIERSLEAAGFSDVSIETLDRTSRAASALDVATAYCQGTPLRAEIEARAPGGLDAATQWAGKALAQEFGESEITGRIRAHVVTAVAP